MSFVGGGVWRTKWNIISDKSSFLFLSCMQGGSAVIEFDNILNTCELKILHKNESTPPHLAYGIDIIGTRTSTQENSRQSESENKDIRDIIDKCTELDGENTDFFPLLSREFTVATCSFYDNLIQIWNVAL